MKRLALFPCFLLALAAAPVAAAAQNTCNLIRQQGNWTSIGDPANRVISAQGPLLVTCTNGEELRADSAVIYQATHEVQLFRQVDYEDPTRSLTSDQATYNSQTGRLYATGNVVFVDKQKGSTLRGPELEYFRAMAGRPESQMTATQRPHVTVRPKNNNNASGANPNRRREPMEIDADRVTSVGDRLLTATGNVVINDNGTRSTAEEAYYDQAAEHVELRRNAQVVNEKYHLQGELVVSDLKDGSVSKVVAQTNARLVSERLTVTGPQLQLFFERDLLQRMVSGQVPGAPPPRDSAAAAAPDSAARTGAAGQRPAAPVVVRAPGDTSTARPAAPPAVPDSATRAPAAGRQRPAPPVLPGRAPGDTSAANRPTTPAPDSAASRPPLPRGLRSVAVAKGFRMEADSLEAILPDQRLRRVNAVGSAKGESWDTVAVRAVRADSGGAAGVTPPRQTEPPAALHEKDVLTADTIIAFFRDSAAAADSARRATQPRDSVRLAGRPATPPPAPGDTAKTELERLLAIGNAHSLYRMRNDSTRNDSTRRADQRPGLNYLIGDRIDLTFKDGEVDLAHVLGLKQGMYLDPDNAPADSARTDTTAAGRRAAARGAAGRPAARPAAGRSGTAPPILGPTTPPPATPPPSRPRPQTPPLPQASAPARASAPLASRAAPSAGGRT
ncbi:MAG: LptA/OstA family protein [Longimicrobiaceae bacterium]